MRKWGKSVCGGRRGRKEGKKRGRGLNEYSESCACAAAGKDGDSAIIIIPVWHCVSSVSFPSLTLCCNLLLRISSIRRPWHRCPKNYHCTLAVEQESDVFCKHAFLFGCRCQTLCAQRGIAMATADAECSLYTKRKSTFTLPYNRSDEGEKPALLDQRR